VEADGPLQLIGGHDCTYVPFDRRACDHLEETIFPLETWGKQVIVGKPRKSDDEVQSVKPTQYILRIVSGADDNTVSFEPALLEPITLQRGAYHEVTLADNVRVKATKPMAVAQYLLGQQATSLYGDPSLTLVPPVEQYRSRYNFLSPATYTSNYVTVVAPEGETVVLDGDTLKASEFEPIGATGYSIATMLLEEAGDHELHSESGAPVGIMLYGFGAYTSYMLPGGLDLRVIANPF
jgi:hypothetical protein